MCYLIIHRPFHILSSLFLGTVLLGSCTKQAMMGMESDESHASRTILESIHSESEVPPTVPGEVIVDDGVPSSTTLVAGMGEQISLSPSQIDAIASRTIGAIDGVALPAATAGAGSSNKLIASQSANPSEENVGPRLAGAPTEAPEQPVRCKRLDLVQVGSIAAGTVAMMSGIVHNLMPFKQEREPDMRQAQADSALAKAHAKIQQLEKQLVALHADKMRPTAIEFYPHPITVATNNNQSTPFYSFPRLEIGPVWCQAAPLGMSMLLVGYLTRKLRQTTDTNRQLEQKVKVQNSQIAVKDEKIEDLEKDVAEKLQTLVTRDGLIRCLMLEKSQVRILEEDKATLGQEVQEGKEEIARLQANGIKADHEKLKLAEQLQEKEKKIKDLEKDVESKEEIIKRKSRLIQRCRRTMGDSNTVAIEPQS